MKVMQYDADLMERPDFIWLCQETSTQPNDALVQILRFYRWACGRVDRDLAIKGITPQMLSNIFGGYDDFWQNLGHANVGWVEWTETGLKLAIPKDPDARDYGAMLGDIPTKEDRATANSLLGSLAGLGGIPKPPGFNMNDPRVHGAADAMAKVAAPQQTSGKNPAAPTVDDHPGNLPESPKSSSEQESRTTTRGLVGDAAARLEEQAKNASAIEP